MPDRIFLYPRNVFSGVPACRWRDVATRRTEHLLASDEILPIVAVHLECEQAVPRRTFLVVVPLPVGFDRNAYTIPRSRHDPKILWVDDAEIVGDRITKVRPIPRNLFTQKTERRIGELGTSCVALVVSDVSVHEAP